MTTSEEPQKRDAIEACVELRRANDWIREAKARPMPKLLFGELWRTGELAILFGDTGTGKSALALQIADSMARGRPIEPFDMTADAQNVVYVDLEMTEKQFEARYASENGPRDAEFLRGHHRFSQRCWRVELDIAEAPAAGGADFADWFRHKIERWIEESGSRVIILDNITYLKRGYYGALDVLPVMQMLNSLRKRLGLSILVIAHTPKRETSRPLDLGDLQGSKLLSKFAASIFGIGRSRLDASGRYIKHVRAHGGSVLFDASHLPAFTMRKLGGNCLGFEFDRFAPENDLLNDIRSIREWETIELIKSLTDEGLSIRTIAAQLEMPKSTVHYLLKMWRPPVENESAMQEVDYGDEYDEASEDEDDDTEDKETRFPGESYRGENTDKYMASIGLRPMWKENHEAELRGKGLTEPAASADDDPVSGTASGAFADDEARPIVERKSSPFPADNITLNGGSASPDGMTAELKRSVDAYGREILVEKEDERGKPMIWYSYDRKGNRMRHERKHHGGVVIAEERAC